MNLKKARALRKEARFHPTDERRQNQVKRLISNSETLLGEITNDPQSTRFKYRELKKQA